MKMRVNTVVICLAFVSIAALGFLACNGGGQKATVTVEDIEGVSMVSLPGGSFRMGHDFDPNGSDAEKYSPDEQPVHTVTLGAFQIGATEITQAQYEAVMGNNPSSVKDPSQPVTNVNASDAALFCNKLSEAAGFEPCFDVNTTFCDFSKNGFRLPTEAEWEYACRAGSSSLFYSGDTEADLGRAGWYIGNSDGAPHPVAIKEPNAWGIYDMHGNVWEWVYDAYDETYHWGNYPNEPVSDPVVEEERFNIRRMRGGSWFNEASECRSATRGAFWTGGCHFYVGFRVARNLQ